MTDRAPTFTHVVYSTPAPLSEVKRLTVCNTCKTGVAFALERGGRETLDAWEKRHAVECSARDTVPCGPPGQTVDELIASPVPICTCGREDLDVAGALHSPMCPRGEWLIWRSELGR